MIASDYQRAVTRTMDKDKWSHMMRLANYGLGLGGEAGEVVELLKKHIFHGHALDKKALRKELGDVLWYLGALCEEAGLDLGDVMKANISKLMLRYPDGFKTADSIARVDESPLALGTSGSIVARVCKDLQEACNAHGCVEKATKELGIMRYCDEHHAIRSDPNWLRTDGDGDSD